MAHTEYKQNKYNYVVFSSSENWVVPKGVKKVDVTVIGGGKEGQKGYSNWYPPYTTVRAGNSGEGGGVITTYDVEVGEYINIIIGSSGGNSIFGSITAKAGSKYVDYSGAVITYNMDTNKNSHDDAQNGKNGKLCPLNNVYYAGSGGGGGGELDSPIGTERAERGIGIHGGGNGYRYTTFDASTRGHANTGGGGGGGYGMRASNGDDKSSYGAVGGSGVIIVRYKIIKSNALFANNF